MRPTDRAKFAELLQAVADVYGKELSPTVIGVYWSALAAYELAAVRQALDRHVRNPDVGQFFPKPADLIRCIEGSTTDAAMQAWAKVERAIRAVGGYESVAFDDALIHRCIDDLGGWPKLCATLVDDLPFRAKDFQTAYRGFAARRELPVYPAYLVGRFEASNRMHGHPVAPPVLIGEREEAMRVLQFGGAQGALAVHRLAEMPALRRLEAA